MHITRYTRRHCHVLAGHTRGDPDAVRKVKDVFGACMDQATIETRREKPMMDVLASMGGWPVLETSWNANSFSILDTLIKLNDIGLSVSAART